MTQPEPAQRLAGPALTALSDDELPARLWRAAEARLSASTTRAHDHAGLVCLQVIDELTRRRAPL